MQVDDLRPTGTNLAAAWYILLAIGLAVAVCGLVYYRRNGHKRALAVVVVGWAPVVAVGLGYYYVPTLLAKDKIFAVSEHYYEAAVVLRFAANVMLAAIALAVPLMLALGFAVRRLWVYPFLSLVFTEVMVVLYNLVAYADKMHAYEDAWYSQDPGYLTDPIASPSAAYAWCVGFAAVSAVLTIVFLLGIWWRSLPPAPRRPWWWYLQWCTPMMPIPFVPYPFPNGQDDEVQPPTS